jgi:hypothetical protein
VHEILPNGVTTRQSPNHLRRASRDPGECPGMSRDSWQRVRAWGRRVLGPVKPIERPARRLVICPYCNSDRVVPLDFEERGDDGWWMHVRCGECGARRDVLATDAEADRYGRALDAGTRQIADDLERLRREPTEVLDFHR